MTDLCSQVLLSPFTNLQLCTFSYTSFNLKIKKHNLTIWKDWVVCHFKDICRSLPKNYLV